MVEYHNMDLIMIKQQKFNRTASKSFFRLSELSLLLTMAVLALRTKMEEITLYILGMERNDLENFEFIVNETPITSLNIPLITVISYCILIPILQNFMSKRSSPPLKYILIIHNIFLMFISLFLSIFLFVTILSFHTTKGYPLFVRIICGLNHFEQQGTLTLIYYINYLLKYYEVLYLYLYNFYIYLRYVVV